MINAPRPWIHVSVGRRHDRKRSPWYICWPDSSARSGRAFLSYPTRPIAERARKLKEDELNSWVKPPAAHTWNELVDEYCATLPGTIGAKHTADVDRTLADFAALCAPDSTRGLTPALCDRYFAQRRQGLPRRTQPLKSGDTRTLPLRVPSEASLSKEFAHLHALFQFGCDRDYLAKNPLIGVRKPKSPGRTRPPPAEPEWVALLRHTADVPGLTDRQGWYILILLAAVTGYDQQVLLARTIKDVKLGDAETQHVGLLKAGRAKTAKHSARGLPPAVAQLLATRIAALPDGATRLFTWRHFQTKQWNRLRRAAGFGHRFRDLRAAAGTRQAVAHALADGARALDHSSAAVFRRHYAGVDPIELAAALRTPLPELPPLPAFA